MNTIAIDAMSGDHGPTVTIPAALQVLKQHASLRIILVGDITVLREHLQRIGATENERLRLYPASQQVGMHESPILALRTKKDSSMRIAIDLVKQGLARACVSAGNTGALMAIARFVLKTLPGIDRPALSTLLPTTTEGVSVRILDLGANIDSTSEHLFQFAVMGSVLASAVDNIARPKLALLNIGSEDIKGNEQVRKAGQLLAKTAAINYIGYIEGDDLYKGIAHVIICDGFVGNVALKVTEGVVELIMYYIKLAFKRNWFARLTSLLALRTLKSLAKQLDPAHYNGASLIGLQGSVIKSHGSANVVAFTHAIEVAISEIEKSIPKRIHERVAALLHKQDHNEDERV